MSQLDAPNKQVLGLDPPWVEGTGGESGGATPTPQRQQQTGEERGEDTDLESLTKAELLEHARVRGVKPANNDMTKDELIAAIQETEQ